MNEALLVSSVRMHELAEQTQKAEGALAKALAYGDDIIATLREPFLVLDHAGIPEELLEKVFDKGETDPDKEGGAGLGLAIVKAFTEAHGGKVSVESKEGAGSTFRFSLHQGELYGPTAR